MFAEHRPLLLQLLERHRQQQLPHALLLASPVGYGELAFAEQLAKGLLCEKRLPQGLACGECASCLLFPHHPDFLVLTPAEGKQAIAVDDVRLVQEQLVRTSHRNRGKVVWVHPAEGLGQGSFNALLKSLEEPVSGVTWLLSTARARSLPATIRSRCQSVRLPLHRPQTHPFWGDLPPQWLLEGNRDSHAKAWQDSLERIEKGQLSPVQVSVGKGDEAAWCELLYRRAHQQARLALQQGRGLYSHLHQAEAAIQARQALASNAATQLVIDDALLAWSYALKTP
jgi:hypothetical protein